MASRQTLTLTARERLAAAARRKPVDRPPVWLMRQAGRCLPSYRALREKHDFLDLCLDPELAAEAALTPLAAFDPDGLIIFNDITTPLIDLGLAVRFEEGSGPVIEPPVRSMADASRLADDVCFDADTPVARAIRILRERAGPERGVIGFCGAPYTLACYAVEGRPSRSFHRVQRMRFEAPELLHALLEKSTPALARYLAVQAEAGADLVQVFDTWAGHLDPEGFRAFALPYAERVIEAARRAGVPVVYYVRGGAPFLEDLAQCGADVIGVDWTLDLEHAARACPDRALQGNLNPYALFAQTSEVARATREMLAAAPRTGYIANLGHGLLPDTPVECVRAFVDAVKASRDGH